MKDALEAFRQVVPERRRQQPRMLQIPKSGDEAFTGPAGRPLERVLDRRMLLSVIAAVVLLVGIVGASVWQSEHNAGALAAARATRVRRDASTGLLLAAQDAETSQRGYLLTGNPANLEPFEQAEQLLPGLFLRVEAGAAQDPRLVTLRQVLDAKIAELRQTINLAKAGDLPDALAIVRTNAGSVNMSWIRTIIASLEREQDGQLLQQVAAVTEGSRLLVGIDVAGLIMVLALSGLIALGLRDYLATLRQAQARTEEAYATLERNNSRLDEAVRHRTAALTAANEEIQRFAYIVSHDLRAPLVNIMGFTSELEQATAILSRHALTEDAAAELREAAQDDIPEALRFIKSSTEKMDRLISAILRLSREGRRVLAPERLDMQGLLGQLVETMRHQAERNGAEVTVGSVPDLVADRLAIEQVFGNIVENALKYLKPGRPGRVRITGQHEGTMVRFEVEDNGRGIAARDYERVFELFRRAGDQTVPGEGIGLAHVRALVRRLGGSVDCVSKLDAGSTFVVKLPAVALHDQEIDA